jgi:hypothetical protein
MELGFFHFIYFRLDICFIWLYFQFFYIVEIKMIKPIDEKWRFRVCGLDGGGYKPAMDLPPVKKKYHKNMPWKYCLVIVKWWDDETGAEGYDRCIFLYESFCVELWTDRMNYWDWLYGGCWVVAYDVVTNDAKEVGDTIRKYLIN